MIKVRKDNRVLQIQEVEWPNFEARGYVRHEAKAAAQPFKMPEKPKPAAKAE